MSKYTERPAYKEWLERKKIRISNQRAEWKENGLCIRCGKERFENLQECINCVEKRREQSKKRREAKIKNKLCSECGKVAPRPKRRKCEGCANKMNLYMRNKQTKEWRVTLRNDVFAQYGNKCNCCGETEILFLEIDHINNDGANHRKTIRGGVPMYFYLKKNNYPKDNFQLLCRNCNYGKFKNGGICPHKSK